MAAITETEHPELAPDVERPPASGDRFVATALIVLAVILLGFQVLADEFVPPMLAFGLVFGAIGIALALRRRRWLLITAIVLVVLNVGGGMPFFLANIAHPESPLSFLLEAFRLLAALTAGIGAIAGLRGARPGARRPIALAAAGLAVAAVVSSLVVVAGVDSDLRQADDVAVEVGKVAFPERVEAPAGAAVLWVDNQDPIRHTLVIEGAGVHAELPASAAVRVTADLAAGTYRFFCDVPGHEHMEGELVVR
ncbi:MAG TPA: cupredoxin domain-containing protein [Egibacteraceae bacterium]|nr:cupredoxin domain-containing protein [Egibacteraceae bacterium]